MVGNTQQNLIECSMSGAASGVCCQQKGVFRTIAHLMRNALLWLATIQPRARLVQLQPVTLGAGIILSWHTDTTTPRPVLHIADESLRKCIYCAQHARLCTCSCASLCSLQGQGAIRLLPSAPPVVFYFSGNTEVPNT